MTTKVHAEAYEFEQAKDKRYRYLLASADLSMVPKTCFVVLCQTMDGTATTEHQEAKSGLLSSIHAEIAVQREALEDDVPFDGEDLAELRTSVGLTCKRLLDTAKIIEGLDAVQCLALLARVEEVLVTHHPRSIEAEIVYQKMQASNGS